MASDPRQSSARGSATRRLDDIIYGIIRERRPGEDRGDLLSDAAARTRRTRRPAVRTPDPRRGHDAAAGGPRRDGARAPRGPSCCSTETRRLGPAWKPSWRPSSGNEPVSPQGRRCASRTRRRSSTRRCGSIRRPTSPVARQSGEHDRPRASQLPKGHIILISLYATHRDPRFFPEPDAFRPERWLDGPGEAAAAWGIHAVRHGLTEVHRRRLRPDGGHAPARDDRSPVAVRARPGRGPDAPLDHPATAVGHARAHAVGRRPTLTGPTQSPPSGSRRRHRGSS